MSSPPPKAVRTPPRWPRANSHQPTAQEYPNSSNVQFFFRDDQGSVVAVTDSSGAVVERYEYNDFGQPSIFDNQGNPRTASAIGNALMYTGRQYDAETGLYYYRTRYLDPRAGRFTTRDTIGIWGDPMNLGNGYTYVGNNPWTMIDPFGREADELDAMLNRARTGGVRSANPPAGNTSQLGISQASRGRKATDQPRVEGKNE